MTSDPERPAGVLTAVRRAESQDFAASSGDDVGPLLAVAAAGVPHGGCILEIGTGCGVGLAWILAGLGDRDDVRVVTVEADADLAAVVRADVPAFVEVRHGRFEDVHPTLDAADLVFADAEGGKWTDFHVTRDLVRPGGLLVLDDLDASRYERPDHRAAIAAVVRDVRQDERFVVAELAVGTGLLLATRVLGRLDPRPPTAPLAGRNDH